MGENSQTTEFGEKTLKSRFVLVLELLVVVLLLQLADHLIAGLLAKFGIISAATPLTILILLITSISFVLVLAVTYLSQRLRGKQFKAYGLGFDRFPNLKTLGFLFLGSLVLQALDVFVIEKIATNVFHTSLNTPEIKSTQELLAFILAGFIGGGLREELYYRGYLINKIAVCFPEKYGILIGTIFQIMLFASNHTYQGVVGIFETAIAALVFSLIYLRTRSLWSAVIFHGLFDLSGILAIYFHL